MPDSQNLGDMQFVDYAIKSGRALAVSDLQGNLRAGGAKQARPGDSEDLQLMIQRSKEVRRSVDYLETRPDIDCSEIAYLGSEQGHGLRRDFHRFGAAVSDHVFLDGGFFLAPPQRGRDQVDFAPRITKPVLMVNGKYDFTFSPERSQEPLVPHAGNARGG